ncbi:NADH(P)-binding protein [Leptospira ryugenii]|uniref:NADH(P)-binding protein n=1 Tax=Leptospira ryugenii TaxID=1917863 RepID=A0A2P2E4A1_9LEPT|nr:SDR family oxidoreductase [Leptospira ryugenii]GBF51717.1 NADH(P)-binding protein [Leptospira ryugenii]
MKAFVYGAKGSVGSDVVRFLTEKGVEVLGGTREPKEGEKRAGLQWVYADAKNPSKGTEVLKEVEAAFFLSPPGHMNQHEILGPWLEAAKSYGLKKVVLMTAMGIEYAPPETPFRKLELFLESSGIPWNILRPNWFMQNFQTYWIGGILSQNKIFFPGGDAKASFIDTRDIAKTAAALLTSDRQNNQAFTLTGPEALDHNQIAKEISKVTGKNIEYVNISPEEFKKGLVSAGLSPEYSDMLVYIAGVLREGQAALVNDAVKSITGSDAISFAKYASDNQSVWK